MTRILRTTRNLPKESLTFAPVTGVDGQGKPAYGSPVGFAANVLEYDAAMSKGAQHVIKADGSEVLTPLTLYVQGDETDVPDEGDRVTRGGRNWIVRERTPVSGLYYTAAEPDHYRLRLAREGA